MMNNLSEEEIKAGFICKLILATFIPGHLPSPAIFEMIGKKKKITRCLFFFGHFHEERKGEFLKAAP